MATTKVFTTTDSTFEVQAAKVLRHLRTGATLTSIEAIDRWRITRLAAIVHRLRRAGHTITSTTHTNASGRGRYARYSLALSL